MNKGIRFLMAMMLAITLIPMAKADGKILTIDGVNLKMMQNTLKGVVKVCNRETETMNFVLEAKNLNTNHLYNRRLSLPASDCNNFILSFKGDFAQMSNVGDTIRLNIRKASSKRTEVEYKLNVTLDSKILEGDQSTDKCKDVTGKDGVYTNLCVGDFITHQPTGLRIKVLSKDSEKIDLLVNHVRWGGTKSLRISKGKSVEIVAANGSNTRVLLSNLEGATGNNVSLNISTY